MNRELTDAFDSDADYVSVTDECEYAGNTRILTYVVGTAKYVYNYDRTTGDLLDSTEYENDVLKLKYENVSYDKFGRTNNVKFTLDNGTAMVYNYTYKSDYEDGVASVKLPNNITCSIDTDAFGRLTARTLNTSTVLKNEYVYKSSKTNSAYTTPLVESEKLIAGSVSATYKYTYDSNNNILTVRNASNALISSYQYDGLNRLIRENIVGGNTTVYKYDKGGNLQFKKVFAYSAASGSTVTELLNSSAGSTVNYGYSGDLLTSYNGSGTLEYDNYGNPKKWFKHGTGSSSLKYTLQWGHVSNLTAIIDDDSGIQYSYKYNDQGIRTEKVVNGVTHKYYLQGEQIIAEKYGTKLIKFYYDTNRICGFNYNNKDYYYRKNMQGDIIAIYDGSGTCYATYGYDAWGRFTIFTNVDDIANINPFRYRGYYFDSESNLYYLNSRYYDPEVGRFISPDVINCIEPETIGGLNLYSYCENNPIMRVDPRGHAWYDVLAWIGLGLFAAALTVVTLGAAGIAIGGIVGGIVMGAAIGTLVLGTAGAAIGAVGGMIYDAANGNTFGTSIWTWTKAGFGIGTIAGAVIGGAIGGAAGVSLYGANNLMLWTGLGKDGATIAAKEASKMGLKTIGQTFGGKVISMFPKAIANKMWIWASKLAASTASMSSITVLTGLTIFETSVYWLIERPILIERGIEIIRRIFGG